MRKAGMSWFWGLAIILVGVALLLNSMGVTSAHDFIVRWWPVIFIIIGVGKLGYKEYFSGLFWLIAGIVVGLFTTKTIHYNGDIWEIIWSLIIIFIGLRLIFRPALRNHFDTDGSAALFSGATKKINDKNFKGTSVSAIFGGAKLDLRNATIDKDGALISVSAVFGGVEILVPKNVPVRIDAAAIFGGHEDKRDTSTIDNSLPVITIQGEAIFGGIEVKD